MVKTDIRMSETDKLMRYLERFREVRLLLFSTKRVNKLETRAKVAVEV